MQTVGADDKMVKRAQTERRTATIVVSVWAVVMCVGAVLLAIVFANMESDARAYAAAPPCVGAADSSCVLSQSATVVGTGEDSGGKSTDYWVELQWSGSGSVRADLDGPSGVWSLLSTGYPVTVTVWHGQVMTVTYQQATIATLDVPGGQAPAVLGLVVMSASWLVSMILFLVGVRSRRFERRGALLGSWAMVSGLVCGMMFVVADRVDYTLFPVGMAVAGVLTIAGLYAAKALTRRKRARLARRRA